MSNLARLTTPDEVVVKRMTDGRDFHDWQRLAVARAVAATVIGYRFDHELTQLDMAKRCGWRQPQIARIESGEVDPALSTLMRLANATGLEFTISITPEDREPTQLTVEAQSAVVATYEHDRSSLRFSVAG